MKTDSVSFFNVIYYLRSLYSKREKEIGGVFTFNFSSEFKSVIYIKDFIQIPNKNESSNKYSPDENLYRGLIHSFPENVLFGDWHSHISNRCDPSKQDDETMYAKSKAIKDKVYSMILTAENIAVYEYTPKKRKLLIKW